MHPVLSPSRRAESRQDFSARKDISRVADVGKTRCFSRLRFPKFSGNRGRLFFPFQQIIGVSGAPADAGPRGGSDPQPGGGPVRRAIGKFSEKGSNVKCFADFVSV